MKLALGTVQFGLDYGVSNLRGKVPAAEVGSILELAARSGIQTLDTAHSYGDCEEVLGLAMSKIKSPFEIITKTKTLAGETVRSAMQSFELSLKRLRQDNVHGLLVHNVNDLLGPEGKEFYEALMSLKAEGRIRKLGVSVYNSSEIDAILSRYSIDIIQLPINPLDQRLLKGGELRNLRQAKVEIHARSIFLQGLLLMPETRLDSYFDPIRPILSHYHADLANHGLTPLEGALLFLDEVADVDVAVLGVCREEELREILQVREKIRFMRAGSFDFAQYSVQEPMMLNPAMWKLHNRRVFMGSSARDA